MKPKESKVVIPKPYFKIVFGCTNRAFYNVKDDLINIADSIDMELHDGYITEYCDYEGDLEEIKIWRETYEERGVLSKKFVEKVLEHYDIDADIPDDMVIILAIR